MANIGYFLDKNCKEKRFNGERKLGPSSLYGIPKACIPIQATQQEELMFDIDLPWWEFVLRGAIVYCALLFLVRISGKRTVGQFTPFDLLVVMLLSEAVSNSLSAGDDSITGGLLIAGTLVALNITMAVVSARSPKLAKIIDGECVLLGRDGKVFFDVAKRSRIARSDIDQALREADVELHEVRCIFLEADGTITILKKKDE